MSSGSTVNGKNGSGSLSLKYSPENLNLFHTSLKEENVVDVKDDFNVEQSGDTCIQADKPVDVSDELICSRYGRVRKRKSLGPDMELTPLLRQNKKSRSKEHPSLTQSTLNSWFSPKAVTNDEQKLKSSENGLTDTELLLHKEVPTSFKNGSEIGKNKLHSVGSPDNSFVKRKGRPRKDSLASSKLKENSKNSGRPTKTENTLKPQLELAICQNSLDKTVVNSFSSEMENANTSNSSSLLECMNVVECCLGDLLWSKIPGHPWWPCMVAFNPFSDVYVRTVKRRNATCKSYHVQYFGPSAERGWTVEGRVMLFDGKKLFDILVTKVAELPKNSKHDQLLQSFKIAPSKMSDWEIAVSEAEAALKMTREERIEELTYVYTLPNGQSCIPGVTDNTPSKKIAHESKLEKQSEKNTTENANGQSSVTSEETSRMNNAIRVNKREKLKKKIVNRTEKASYVEGINNQHKLSPTALHPKGNGSCFEVYLTRHLNEIINDHPEFSSKEAEGYLLYQWNSLSEVQKLRYSVKFDGDQKPMNSNLFSGKSVRERTVRRRISGGFVDGMSEADTDISETSSLKEDAENGECRRHDKVCSICEVTGNVITCQGPCMRSFHRGCLGLTKAPPSYVCSECSSGKHKCFSCKLDDGEVKKCSISSCGRYYHQNCLNRVALSTSSDSRIVCSLHACRTCFNESPKSVRCRKGRMIRCIQCPTAFHFGESCVSAGSIFITASHILCAKHFHPQKNNKFHSHVNSTWCFICSAGGNLICCESCPAAFHQECLNIDPPEGNYYCNDCLNEKHPCYGDIVWVKLGVYRWWPAEVQHPNNVPLNIQNLEHNVGEFPVQFFGSHDYFWMHKGRVFLFHEGDKGSRESSNGRNLAQVFHRAIEEATEAFQKWKITKSKVVQGDSLKPPPYKHIKMNRPVGKVQIPSVDPATLPSCECNADMVNPCSGEADCMNRILLFECHPSICPAREKCQNQRFQKREYAEARPFRTESRGWGLQAERDIKKGEFVSEYVGELIDEEECEKRLQQLNDDNDSNFYFLTIDKDRIIDAGPKGNLSRFMNHSCQPNCETQKWAVNGDTRVGLFALCDISKGTELTFNYNLDCHGNERLKCGCGSTICSGYIGLRPKTANAASQEKKIREAKSGRKKKKSFARKHDDECYRCGEGGELMMCDLKTCTKSYHLNCLGLTKPSRGRWECPWHHCDICGSLATMLCSFCPNSFCAVHATPGNILTDESGQIRCSEHSGKDGQQTPTNGTS